MKLPRNYFENLSTIKYKEYLKLLPDIKKESTKAIIMLIFTFISLSLLVAFAISPTLNTIIDLQKQLKDSKFVYQELNTKMNSLSNLQQQYAILLDDLPFVFDAIPQNAASGKLIAQIQGLSQNFDIQIISMRVGETTLKSNIINKKADESINSFTFSLEAEGQYEDLMSFAKSLSFFNRIVTIESISLSKDLRRPVLILAIKGRQYFKSP